MNTTFLHQQVQMRPDSGGWPKKNDSIDIGVEASYKTRFLQ